MDWIKVKTSHAEYDFIGAKDNIFRAWIMAMVFVAILEKIPTQIQLEGHLGKKNYDDLERHFKKMGISTVKVLKKVLEDVDYLKRRREHTKMYMEHTRRGSSVSAHISPTRRPHNDCSAVKKEKKEKKEEKPSLRLLSEQNPDIKASLGKMGLNL